MVETDNTALKWKKKIVYSVIIISMVVSATVLVFYYQAQSGYPIVKPELVFDVKYENYSYNFTIIRARTSLTTLGDEWLNISSLGYLLSNVSGTRLAVEAYKDTANPWNYGSGPLADITNNSGDFCLLDRDFNNMLSLNDSFIISGDTAIMIHNAYESLNNGTWTNDSYPFYFHIIYTDGLAHGLGELHNITAIQVMIFDQTRYGR